MCGCVCRATPLYFARSNHNYIMYMHVQNKFALLMKVTGLAWISALIICCCPRVLLLRAEQLADEIKELQGEMADYNTVS